MSKKILLIAVIAIAAVVGFVILRGLNDSDMAGEASPTPTTTPRPSPAGTEALVAENIVTLTDAGFSPTTIKIKKGETVVFKNTGSGMMWVASAMHPTHDVYPTKGGCIGSIFDQCEAVANGGSWTFEFDVTGTWKYHNHRNSSQFGTVVVE